MREKHGSACIRGCTVPLQLFKRPAPKQPWRVAVCRKALDRRSRGQATPLCSPTLTSRGELHLVSAEQEGVDVVAAVRDGGLVLLQTPLEGTERLRAVLADLLHDRAAR